MNILKRNYIEGEATVGASFGGTWKVAIVNASTGAVHHPFGDKFRHNLILNQGLDLFVGSATYYNDSSVGGATAAHLVSTLSRAGVGTSTTAAANSQTGIQAGAVYTQTATSGFNHSTTDDTGAGSRTFVRSYDFAPVASPVTYNEAVIEAQRQNIGALYAYSRFVFPSGVSLVAGQFLRLSYALKITVPCIVTPINVTISNGGFTGDGTIKLVGTFNTIFGSLNSSTAVVGDNGYGWKNFLPFWNGNSTSGTGGNNRLAMLSSAADFPAVGVAPSLALATNSSHVPPASITTGVYTAGSGTRDASYLVAAGNPSATSTLGGLLLYTDSASNRLTSGYLWKFTTPQSKADTKALVLGMRVTITRG